MKKWDPRRWDSWDGTEGDTAPTSEQMLKSCHENAKEARMRLQQAEQEYERCDPGDPRLAGINGEPGIRQRLAQAKSDAIHWDEMANWYRGEVFNGRKSVLG